LRAEKPPYWHIGVIGGSGLAGGIELEDAQEIAVSSAFGEPSGPVTTGRIGAVRFTFLARHGKGPAIPPHAINYRANIDVLKRCGVSDVVAVCAVGSLREELPPGTFVAADQFIDRTAGRAGSFFDTGVVAHVSMADPVCPRMSAAVAASVRGAGGSIREGGCYLAMEGPQFSTRAESRLYRAWGADVIGMTGMPEAKLAREAELPYALLAMVTDYDAWRDEEAGVSVTDVLAVMHANVATVRGALGLLAQALPERRDPSPLDRALEGAVITAPSAMDRGMLSHLDAIGARLQPGE
jgi:5'-methylthioadenosine phosphorylase